jgi:hypothetical protein
MIGRNVPTDRNVRNVLNVWNALIDKIVPNVQTVPKGQKGRFNALLKSAHQCPR